MKIYTFGKTGIVEVTSTSIQANYCNFRPLGRNLVEQRMTSLFLLVYCKSSISGKPGDAIETNSKIIVGSLDERSQSAAKIPNPKSPISDIMKYISVLCFLLVACLTGKAQEADDSTATGTMLLMSGNEIRVLDLDDSTASDLRYLYDRNQFRRRKIRMRQARKTRNYFDAPMTEKSARIPVDMRRGSTAYEEVFSYTAPSGDTRYYFEPDTALGYSLEEMEAFVYGERDARYTITGRGWFWGGLGTGLVAGYLLETSVFSLAVPPLFALSARIPVIRIKPEYISNSRFQYNPDYATGFDTQARSKNTIEALKGSAIGTALGILAFIIVDNNK